MNARACGPEDVRRFEEDDRESEVPETDGFPNPCFGFAARKL